MSSTTNRSNLTQISYSDTQPRQAVAFGTSWNQISVGSSHILGIKSDGTLWSWGTNTVGQLGNQSSLATILSSPVQIGTNRWRSVAAGSNFSLALRSDNLLFAWGDNTFGQLGINSRISTGWVKVVKGTQCTIALRNDGSLWGWGIGNWGQFANNSTQTQMSPIRVVPGVSWKDVAAANSSIIAIKGDGTLWAWGYNGTGELGTNNTISTSSPVQIGTSSNWSLVAGSGGIVYSGYGSLNAVNNLGQLYAWGINTYGQLGIGNTTYRSSPVQVSTSGMSIVQVASGPLNTFVLTVEGNILGTGYNAQGQLGDGTTVDKTVYVSTIFEDAWASVSVGVNSAYGITRTGLLYAWGYNATGELGIPDLVNRSSPCLVSTYSWTQVFGGGSSVSAVRSDGTLWSWGYNIGGKLGDLTIIHKSSPVQVSGGGSWSLVACSESGTSAIAYDGSIYGWGYSLTGELGDPSANANNYRSSPVQVGYVAYTSSPTQIGASSWIAISAGLSHVVAIRSDDTLWGWGSNTYGQTGTGAGFSLSSPTQISSSSFAFISAGYDFTAAIDGTGKLYTWGNNLFGQLGLTNSVSTAYSWSVIASNKGGSSNHVLAIRNDGMLFAWGRNHVGQLGTGDTFNRSSPVQISTLSWTNVAVGMSTSMALRGDGMLFVWGDNTVGSVGDGTTLYRSSPIQIGTSSWISIATGGSIGATLAIQSNGTMWGWGYNTNGQIGDGTTVNKSSPVQVTGGQSAVNANSWTVVNVGGGSPVVTLAGMGSYAIRSDGLLFAWGLNTNGQLGDNTQTPRSSPVQIGTSSWSSISSGSMFSMFAIDVNNRLFGWGYNGLAELGDSTLTSKSSPVLLGYSFRQVAATGAAASPTQIGVKLDGSLWIWGTKSLVYATDFATTSYTMSWSQIAAGSSHGIGIRTDGRLFGWGNNASGQIGDNSVTNRGLPTQTLLTSGLGDFWKAIAAGFNHTIGIRQDGLLAGWGYNGNKQTGTDFSQDVFGRQSVPVVLTWLPGSWTSVAAGGNNSVGIQTDGSMYVWGDNTFKQSLIPNLSWTKLAAGSGGGLAAHFLAIRSDGKLFASGGGGSGQIGDNVFNINRSQLTQIGTSSWTNVAAGNNFSLGIKLDGTLWAWGDNTYGQLGLGDTIARSSPVQVFASPTISNSNANSIFFYGGQCMATPASTITNIIGTNGLTTLSVFTIECWIYQQYRPTTANIGPVIGDNNPYANTSYWSWGPGSTGALVFAWTGGTALGTTIIPLNTWTHIALQVNATVLKMFINGKLEPMTGTVTLTNATSTLGYINIGGYNGGGVPTPATRNNAPTTVPTGFYGLISNLRIVKNTVLYNSDFVPSTSPLTAIANTTLLVAQTTNMLLDQSSNSYVLIGANADFKKPIPATNTGLTPFTQYQSFTQLSWTSVSAGNSFAVAIASNATLWGWGINDYGQTGYPYTGRWSGGANRSSPTQIGTSSWSQVAAGGSHVVGIKIDGTLWGWGSNYRNQLGTPIATYDSVWQSPRAIQHVQTDLNGYMGAIIRNDYTLWTWGNGEYGGLGNNTCSVSLSPVQIPGSWINVMIAGSGGGGTSVFGSVLALKIDGTLWAWGYGANNMGFNDLLSRSSPTQIGTSSWSQIYSTQLAKKIDGSIWGWGANGSGQLGQNDTVTRSSPVQIKSGSYVQAYAGGTATWILDSNNVLFGTGGYLFRLGGGLGNAVTSSSPIQVATSVRSVGSFSQYQGYYSTILVKTDGTVWGWGDNAFGELGMGDTVTRSSAVQLSTRRQTGAIQAQGSHVLYNDGSIEYAGYNQNLGTFYNNDFNFSYPVLLSSFQSVGESATSFLGERAVLTNTGNLYTWGYTWPDGSNTANGATNYPISYGGIAKRFTTNAAGENGLNNMTTPEPVQITTGSWTSVAAGDSYSAAVRSDGALYTWGKNDFGQLGNPTSWISVQAYGSMYALRQDGALFVGGYNNWGQLSLGDTVHRSSPVQVSTLMGSFSQISAGWATIFMLRNDGILFGCGGGTFGKLGYMDGLSPNANRSSPVQVNTKKWKQVSQGIDSAVGIATDGTLWTWGYNALGQLGDGSTTRSSPVQIGSDSNWSSINSGHFGSTNFGIKSDGTLWGWGFNVTAAIGDNTTINRSSPVQVPGSWLQVSSQGDYNAANDGATSYRTFTGAIKTDGTLWTWGKNSEGQLGLGDTIDRSSPTQVGTGTWKAVFVQTKDVNSTTGASYFYYGGMLALDSNNNLYYWGDGTYTAAASANSLGGTAVSVSSPIQIGSSVAWNSLAGKDLTKFAFNQAWFNSAGDLYLWGSNDYGRVGDNTTVAKSSPVIIASPALRNGDVPSANQLGVNSWIAVSAGFSSMSAIRSDNTLWTWGLNNVGQLGDNSSINRSSPVQVTSFSYSQIYSGNSFSIGINTSNALVGFGAQGWLASGAIANQSNPLLIGTSSTLTGNYYQLSSLPNKVAGSWTQAAVGGSHIAAIKNDGTLWLWGDNSVGQVGQSAAYQFYPPIAAHTAMYAIKPNGELWAWGDNTAGQLAQSDTVARSSPIQVASGTSWKQIATGNSHTVAIKSDNTLWTWGLNNAGQLGLNDTITRSSPIQIGTNSWSQIAAGGSHTVALALDSTVYAWGLNSVGQLGDNTTVNKSSPIQVSTSSWTQISARNNNTAGIKAYSLYTWGDNSQWQLGDATSVNRSSPVQVFGTSVWSWRLISVGATHMVAIKTPDDTLFAWGYNNVGQLGVGDVAIRSSATQVGGDARWNFASAGVDHTLAVRKDYVAFGWGLNNVGQIGDNTSVNKSIPTLVLAAALATNVSIYQISAGASNSLALSTAGTYYAWGLNNAAQVLGKGDGTTTNKSSPVLVGTPFLANAVSSPVQVPGSWTSVSAGDRHTAAIKTDGTLWTWGYNLQGQLGVTTSHTISVMNIGALYSSIVRSDGTLWIWGYNNYGTGLGFIANVSSPVQLGYYSWSTISTGNSHSMAIRSDGYLFGWGLNTSGEVGDNTTISRSGPVQIGFFNDWKYISAGYQNSLAIRNNGMLYGWGNNTYGQSGTTSWAKIATGYSHSLAIRSDGQLYAWGFNTSGQLGNGGAASLSSPAAIGGFSWNAIAAGLDISIAIRGDGLLFAWGNNVNGAIGDGTTVSKSSPVLVTGGLAASIINPGSWTQVYAGRNYLVAQRSDGTVYAWGYNANGQLGLGDTAARSSPVQIGSLSWNMIATGGYHTLGLQANKLYSWGDNTYGQLGDSTTVSKSSPIQLGANSYNLVVASISSSYAIDSNSKLWSWGNNNNGQLGNGNKIHQSSPIQIGTSSWTTISSSQETVYGIKPDLTLWGWGNGYGQNGQLPMLQSLTTPYSWTMIGGGGQTTTTNHYLGIRSDGLLFAWGYNNNGQLGLGDTLYRSSPTQVGTGSWSMVISTYDYYSHAITSDGRLFTWGNNNSGNAGMLGDSSTIDKSSPVQISGSWVTVGPGIGISYISAGLGSLYTWGVNTYGGLGDSTTVTKSSPVKIGTSSWTQVAATKLTKMARTTAGGLFTWGYNNNGQLGANTATTVHRSAPVQVGALTTWSTLYMGGNGLNAAGLAGTTLYIWGDNTYGQLGDNTTVSKSSPVTVTGTWSYLRLGNTTTIAVNSVGALFTWGSSTNGQLGDGSTVPRSSPVQVGFPTSYNYVGATDAGTLFARRIYDNLMFAWGPLGNIAPAIGVALSDTTAYSSPVQIPAGVTATAAQIITSASSPVQLAANTVVNQSAYSVKFTAGTNSFITTGSITQTLSGDLTLETWIYITSVANNSTIFAFGGAALQRLYIQSTTGTLAYWDTSAIATAGNVSLNTWTHIAMVRKTNTLRLYVNGTGGTSITYSTTINNGTCFIGSTNTLVDPFNGNMSNLRLAVIAIYDSASASLTVPTSPLSITTSNSYTDTILLTCQNYLFYDSSIYHYSITNNSTTLVLIDTLTPFTSTITPISWTQVSAGGLHVVAAATNVDYNLYAWGYNGQGQLGTNDTVNRSSPTQVGIGSLFNANRSFPVQISNASWSQVVASGGYISVGFKTDGTLWAWGYNATGQLGIGDVINKSSPVQIPGSWSSIGTYTGQSHSHLAGIKTDGTLWLWGVNNYGQLGDNTTTNKSSPIQVGTSSWTQVTLGQSHTVAARSDGTYWAWGFNNYGQLGDYSIINRSSPVQVTSIPTSTVVQLMAAETQTFAYTTNNYLWVWGRNVEGELGTNDVVSRSSPVQLGNTSTLIAGQYSFVPAVNVAYKKPYLYDLYSVSPIQVGTSSWISVSAGSDMTAGVTLNNSLFNWGKNDQGQLGDGSVTSKVYPIRTVQVAGSTNANTYSTFFTAGSGWISASTIPINVASWANNQDFTVEMWVYSTTATRTFFNLGTFRYNNAAENLITITDTSATISIATSTTLATTYTVNYSIATVPLNQWFHIALVRYNNIATLYLNGIPGTGVSVTGAASPTLVTPAQTSEFGITLGVTRIAWNAAYTGNTNFTGYMSNVRYVVGTAVYTRSFTNQVPVSPLTATQSASGAIQAITGNQTVFLSLQNATFVDNSSYNYPVSSQATGAVVISTTNTFSPYADYYSYYSYSQVNAGYSFVAAKRTDNGYAVGYGLGTVGQLGDNTATTKSSPTIVTTAQVTYLSWPTQLTAGATSSWSAVGAYQSHIVAINSLGLLYTWGVDISTGDQYGVFGVPGTQQSPIFSSTSTLVGIGGTTSNYQPTPLQVGTSSWTKVSAGNRHTLGITSTNRLFGWGYYPGSINSSITSYSWKLLSLGEQFTLGIRGDGLLFAWGQNVYGQLGDGTTIYRSSPVQIGTSSWTTVSAGFSFTTAVDASGRLFAWGSNDYGQLGNNYAGGNYQRSSPIQIGTATSWASTSAGAHHAVALTTTGLLYAWGRGDVGAIGFGDGAYNNWGNTNYSSPVVINAPYIVSNDNVYSLYFRGPTDALSFGAQTAFVFGTGDFTIESWVYIIRSGTFNSYIFDGRAVGGTGINPTLYIDTNMIPYYFVNGANVITGTAINVGTWYHIAVVKISSVTKLYVNGTQTGSNYTDTNNYVMGTSVNASYTPFIGMNAASTNGFNGYLSNLRVVKGIGVYTGTFTVPTSPLTATQVAGTNIAAITGTQTSLLIAQNNSYKDNSTNNFALRNFTSFTSATTANPQYAMPAISTFSPFTSYVQVTSWKSAIANSYSTYALRSDNTLWAWGNNTNNELGDSSTNNGFIPQLVGSLTDKWTSFVPAYQSILAIKTDGTLWAWGYNSNGWLGLNTTLNISLPTQVGTSKWVSLAGGSIAYSVSGSTSDGKVYVWGYNGYGQLTVPLNYNADQSSPVQIASVKQHFGFGRYHGAYLDTNNNLQIMGYAASGQLGRGDTIARSSPVQLGTGNYGNSTPVQLIAGSWNNVGSGNDTSYAIDSNYVLYFWGKNTVYQATNANYTSTYLSSPVTVTSNITNPTDSGVLVNPLIISNKGDTGGAIILP